MAPEVAGSNPVIHPNPQLWHNGASAILNRFGGQVERQDVERIARAALKELGVSRPEQAVIAPDEQPGHWRIDYQDQSSSGRIRIKCGQGTTPQWVREQIFAQYLAQN